MNRRLIFWSGLGTVGLAGAVASRALDETLQAIAARYGARTASFVEIQLEYPSRT
jgi:hypothetical protein